MPLYALTIFISAFLLFLLQLIMARQILPWFGGSAAVWATCMVFFQVMLLFGYAYADWTARWLAPKRQAVLHALLLICSLVFLPVIPAASWKPTGAESPALRIVVLLACNIGLPYLLLSATSPLLQLWFARAFPGRSPYRLFALSNLASMSALLGYPLAIEPWIATSSQAKIWSFGYAAFAMLCCGAAWHGSRFALTSEKLSTDSNTGDETSGPPPAFSAQLLWAALAAIASVLLLAVTNHLTQDVASIPLLWALPLAIYLLTFILCFDGRGWYRRDLFMGLTGVFLFIMAAMLVQFWFDLPWLYQIGIFSAGLFVVCMFCHGELSRLRPSPRHLTRFYLMIALGGAMGAMLVGILAPLFFSGVYELGFGLCALAALWLWQLRASSRVFMVSGVVLVLFTFAAAVCKIVVFTNRSVVVTRNFYGVLRVLENDTWNIDTFQRTLSDGMTTHGEQFPKGRYERAPTTYYTDKSGIGRTLRAIGMKGARVGVIGLGAGTIAAYGKPGDVYRFYEINPSVIQIANRDFTFLKNSAATIETVLGDARLNLEREPDQKFVVIAVDAFSGDSIPVHLLSSEALALYLRHLIPEGVIAFHITNKSLNLAPVLQRLAIEHELQCAYIVESVEKNKLHPSEWVLLTRSKAFLALDDIRLASFPILSRPGWRLWTDDYSNLLQVLK